MGQQKGNPTPSYQNQAYINLYGQKSHAPEKSNMTTPVMIDVDYRPAQAILSYGSFTDSTTQSASLANTPYSMKLNTIEGANGFTIENDNSGFPTRIKALRTGVYNLQYSAQLENTANTNIDFNIWLSYTGSNVSNSNGHVSLTKVSGQFANLVSSWNYVIPIQQMDYVELKWMCNDTSGQIFASGSNGSRPATPSVIATITQVG
jgi:hypothetical protein